MDDRRTIKSGLPRELAEELDGFAPKLIAVGDAKYRLERLVGRGALFVTFRATRIDAAGAVPHAVKVFRPSLLRAWPAGARVLSREQRRVLSIMNERVPPSPHVVRLFDIAELDVGNDRVPFFALEWIEDDFSGANSPSLFERVRTSVATHGVALDPLSSFRAIEGIARGLDWVHRHGLLHRGLSPSNVLLTGRGDAIIAKVSDVAIARPLDVPSSFGLAAETVTRSSEPYRAPEQLDERGELSPACDVFAFGAVAHFVLTGKPRFSGQTLIGIDSIHPAHGDLAELDEVLARLTAFDPGERPATIQSAWELLEPPLRRAVAAASKPTHSLIPPSDAPWVWTERHRPSTAKELRCLAIDPDGHALAVDAGPTYFDGRSFRKPPPCSELDVIKTIRATSAGEFLVGGRTSRGRARLFRLEAEGWTRLPIDVSGSVVATTPDGSAIVRDDRELSFIDMRGRIALPGLHGVTGVHRLENLWVIVGGGGGVTLDAEARVARPQRLPDATVAASLGGTLFLGGALGLLWVVRAIHSHRLHIAEEQTRAASITAMAIGPDGGLVLAAGDTLLSREGPGRVRPLFSEPGSAPCVGLAPRRNGLLAFLRDGRVLEGRAFAAPAR
jgi:serine/threonine protein kinase